MRTAAITREVLFEAAHMLSGHDGLCANLHGHSYRAQVTLRAPIQEYDEIRSDGDMVMDFGTLKNLLQRAVLDKLDHALIVSHQRLRNLAEEELVQWALRNRMRVVELPGRSTVENIATWVKDVVLEELAARGQVSTAVSVRLWETEKSFVEVPEYDYP